MIKMKHATYHLIEKFYYVIILSMENIIKKITKEIRETIEADANRDYIQSVSLFGSFLRGEENEASDIDLLFETRKTMSLFKIIETQLRLEARLGRKVDFIEKNSLDKYIKDEVLKEAQKVYENGQR